MFAPAISLSFAQLRSVQDYTSVMVFMSDGEGGDPSQFPATFQEGLRHLPKSFRFFAVAFCNSNPQQLSQLVIRDKGGVVFAYHSEAIFLRFSMDLRMNCFFSSAEPPQSCSPF